MAGDEPVLILRQPRAYDERSVYRKWRLFCSAWSGGLGGSRRSSRLPEVGLRLGRPRFTAHASVAIERFNRAVRVSVFLLFVLHARNCAIGSVRPLNVQTQEESAPLGAPLVSES